MKYKVVMYKTVYDNYDLDATNMDDAYEKGVQLIMDYNLERMSHDGVTKELWEMYEIEEYDDEDNIIDVRDVEGESDSKFDEIVDGLDFSNAQVTFTPPVEQVKDEPEKS